MLLVRAALLLVGFVGALRRSELVALDRGDLRAREEGVVLAIRRSKTDPEAAGREIGIPRAEELCPVRALEGWLAHAPDDGGPVFRAIDRHGKLRARLSSHAVGEILKRRAAAVGLDPDELGGHSLRSGFATAAARAGATEEAIARQTGHRSLAVLRTYIRRGNLFEDHAASRLGL
ncbi:MAG: site-specific integrase [Vulcanimicrobiaceae bacterium]